tara:strand:+ start:791 stop:1705 length:915 start_codon:yes stop_codon:yes gene_type:complete
MNLLFISSNRLGDAIINIQVLNKFIRENPNIKVTIVSGALPMPLYEDYLNISSRVSFIKQNFNAHWIKLYLNLKKNKYDHIIDFRSSLISYFLNTKSRKIFKMKKTDNIYEQIHRIFKTDIAQDYFIPISNKRLDSISEKNYACIAPFANWMPKEWPIKNYIKCCDVLFQQGISKIYILGSKEDSKRFYTLTNKFGTKLINKCGTNHLLNDYALLKKSSIFIGNDSGMMHLSAMAKAPSVCLFGPTNDKIYYPKLSSNSYLIRSNESYEDLTSNIPDLNSYDKSLMNDLSYDNVVEVIKSILNG